MKGRILDYSLSFGGKQRITLELDTDFVLVNQIAVARGLSDDEVKRDLIVDYGTVARDDDGKMIGFKLPASVDVDAIYPYTRMYKEVEEDGKAFKCYLVYKRSSEMDTKEMAHLIDGGNHGCPGTKHRHRHAGRACQVGITERRRKPWKIINLRLSSAL